MRTTIMLDEESKKELGELSSLADLPKSELIREAIKEFYLKEKRARENLLFFVDLYNENVITKDILFLLLPKKDAGAIIIGSHIGKEAKVVAKNLSS